MAGLHAGARFLALVAACCLSSLAQAQAQAPRSPSVAACESCHRADVMGGSEGVELSGLSQEYLVQQLQDFRAGLRRSATPKALSDAEIEAVAGYYAAIPMRSQMSVVESETAPANSPAGREPLGRRIIEIAENAGQADSRDGKARVVAYVPVGALADGKILAATGGGKTTPCATCHERGLKGDGLFPALAGRSPNYLARQLRDFKTGDRAGANSAQMKPVVERLSNDDMMLLAAYIAALPGN